MAIATVWLEDQGGQRWPVAMTASLGRASSNDIVIDDGKVSRRHALVHKQDDAEYWVIDLGSGNGTYLNGRRVTQPTRLSDGDELALGERALKFRHIAGEATTGPRNYSAAQTIINVRNFECWMLIADIKGSSALASRLPSTELAMLVGRWMGACKEIVDGRGGAINKYLGDGFFAYWPAASTPIANVVAAMRELTQLQHDKAHPRFRLALHVGPVALGGGGSLGEDSLSGSDVVLAFRMEKIAGSLGCDFLASDAAASRLGPAFAFRDLGVHAVPGFDGPGRRFYAAG